MKASKEAEKWSVYEITLNECKKKFNNPFKDVGISAYFNKDNTEKKVTGFYDGGSIWKIRFMPEETGKYSFRTESNISELNGLTGEFTSIKPTGNNHGPVKVAKKYHLSYADGTPMFMMGTTAYVWFYRPEEIRKKSLESFSKYDFNKVRILFFPKHYEGKFSDVNVSYEPPFLPFEGKPGHLDFSRFDVRYFQNYEDRVKELMDLGIEAETILYHIYDSGQWGIDTGMNQEDDLFFIRYITARLSAYRNIWWSVANEWDLAEDSQYGQLVTFNRKDWDLLGEYIKANDPYSHLLSIHNWPCAGLFYPNRSWMTHLSYQHIDTYTLLLELKDKYGKPVINDEYQYEGNVRDGWGNNTPEMELLRHWMTAMAGGYGTHGEVYKKKGNNRDLFWSYGGTMVGQSPKRLKYLREIMESCPFQDMSRDYINTDSHYIFSLSIKEDYYLMFFRYGYKGKKIWYGPKDKSNPDYDATIYDVWNCRVIDKLVVEKWHNFELPEWTVLKLVRRS